MLWWAKERAWSVGGLLRFRKKREGGNEMTPIDAEAVQLVLVDSMLPKNTGRMIEQVKRLQDVLPESVECLFDGIEGLVSSVTREGRLDGRRLREAVEMNQCLLQALGVSCEAIDEIVRVGRQCHFAAKLTGGGGGGCVIAVASDEATAADKELLLQSLRERGYEGRGGGNHVTCLRTNTTPSVYCEERFIPSTALFKSCVRSITCSYLRLTPTRHTHSEGADLSITTHPSCIATFCSTAFVSTACSTHCLHASSPTPHAPRPPALRLRLRANSFMPMRRCTLHISSNTSTRAPCMNLASKAGLPLRKKSEANTSSQRASCSLAASKSISIDSWYRNSSTGSSSAACSRSSTYLSHYVPSPTSASRPISARFCASCTTASTTM